MCAHTIYFNPDVIYIKSQILKVKIKDIAIHAGVSTGTVDRVIHNRGRVSKRTRDLVRQSMAELQYKPDIVARTLARREDSLLKALIPYPYQDYYWKIVRDGIEKGFSEFAPYRLNGQIHFYDMNDSGHFEEIATEILAESPDVVLIGSEYHQQTIALIKACEKREIHCIVLNAEITSVPVLTYIGINTYVAGELVGRILRNTRDRTSVLVVHTTENIENTIHLKKKELGLINALDQSDLGFNTDSIVLGNETNKKLAGELLFEKIHKNEVDTVYFSTSRAYQYAPMLRKAFPELFIIGHDLIDHHIHLLKVGVIDLIIDQSGFQMGYNGVKSWLDYRILEQKIQDTQYLPITVVYPENLPYFIQR